MHKFTSLTKMLPKNRSEQYRDVPMFEYAVSRWTGDVLVWLAVRAQKRGDLHQFNHMYAAVMVGNSDHGTSADGFEFADCPVPHDRTFQPGDSIVHMVPVAQSTSNA